MKTAIDLLPCETYAAFNLERKKLAIEQFGMADAVLMFMKAFDQHPVHDDHELSTADFNLARKLMAEEILEMWAGFKKFEVSKTLENKTEFVDGAIDAIYVILWSLLKLGVPVDKCFNEVQRSNMAKLQPDGTCLKNEYGKVQKPAGWTPPDLFGILSEHKVAGEYTGNVRNDVS